jgi:hypothetical protein
MFGEGEGEGGESGGRSMGEIVTVQLGGGANHVGSHFWNLLLEQKAQSQTQAKGNQQKQQQQQDFGVMLRETSRGVLPRACCFDLSGTVSTSYKMSAEYAGKDTDQTGTWSSDRMFVGLPSQAELQSRRDGAPVYTGYWDEYLNLSEETCWRSELVTCFPGFWHGVNAFDCFGDGLDLFSREDTREIAFDRIRRQVEGCDYLQGFQVLADDLSGFGHVCSEVLIHIRDEVTETKPLVVLGLRDHFAQDYVVQTNRSESKQAKLDCMNQTLATCKISELSDAHVVLDQGMMGPNTHLNSSSTNADGALMRLYEVSAMGACAVDSLTLGCRLMGDRGVGSLRDVVQSFTSGRNNKCSLTWCAADVRPYDAFKPPLSFTSLIGQFTTNDRSHSNSNSNRQQKRFYSNSLSECYVLRGVKQSRRETIGTQGEAQEWLVARWKEMEMEINRGDVAMCPRKFVTDPSAHPLPYHFPTTQVLLQNNKINKDMNGNDAAGIGGGGGGSSALAGQVSSLSSVIQFSCNAKMGKHLGKLAEDFKKVCAAPAMSSMLSNWQLDKADCEEMVETLKSMRDSYTSDDLFSCANQSSSSSEAED